MRALLIAVLVTVCLILTAGLSPAELVKIPTDLAALHDEFVAHQTMLGGAPFRSNNALMSLVNDRVVIDAVAAGDVHALKADLTALGMQEPVIFGRTVSGQLPLSSISALSGLASVKFARPALAITNVGLVTSQGDQAMRAGVARATFGVDGTGVTVGVLSDSFNCKGGAAADVASGDLSPVTVIQEISSCTGATDEGRAMLQLVHDVAPGASLAFASAFNGQASFATNILALAGAGANVIVDDVIYFAEPMFQDGIIAQAVDTVVAAGVPYFSSAGNQARRAYQAGFVNSGINLGSGGTNQISSTTTFFAHDFDPGPGVDIFQTVTFPTGTTFISLQWSDPFFSVSGAPGAQTDLNIALFSMAGAFLFGSFGTNVGGDPVQILGVATGSPAQAQIAIGKFAGPDPSLMKYVPFRSTFVVNEFATDSGTIFGHANAVGAEAVAAAAFFNTPEFGVSPPVLETFSSAGTTPILFTTAGAPTFDARADKPEITAPDGTNTTFFGTDSAQDADAFPNFFGTSAAAPHAAAVAALLLEFKPGLTPAAVYSLLEETAIDMGAPGFDNDSGFGLIQADLALTALAAASVDHFLCYSARPSIGTPKFVPVPGVKLVDQFESGLWQVTKPVSLCNPADKNGEGIINPDTHLEGYTITKGPKHVKRTHVEVTNQFGTLFVDTITPDRLLVPTAKDLSSPPLPPTTSRADHYKCYRVTVTRGTPRFVAIQGVGVDDQFTTGAKLFDIKKPTRLCNPVDKNDEGIKNPVNHLMCYQAVPTRGQPKHVPVTGIFVDNQFGPGRLNTVKEEELCVPSSKQ